MNHGSILLFSVLLSVGFAISPAGAEIYKCKGPDGNVLFTGDASQCPGQAAHKSKGQIQSMGSTNTDAPAALEDRPRSAAPPRRRIYDNTADEAQAAVWKARKQEARSQLAAVSKRLPGVRKAAGWCNRGDNVYATDDLGIRRDIPCKSINDDVKKLEKAQAELTYYLEEGLEEECRKAGCLPGWIR